MTSQIWDPWVCKTFPKTQDLGVGWQEQLFMDIVLMPCVFIAALGKKCMYLLKGKYIPGHE